MYSRIDQHCNITRSFDSSLPYTLVNLRHRSRTNHAYQRYATSAINITLPAAGEPESLSYGRAIAIDTTAPRVINVTSTQPNGTYIAGAVIGVIVRFSQPVVVMQPANCSDIGSSNDSSSTATIDFSCEGLPVLLLDASGETGDKNATYAGGNGTVELIFEYEASVNYYEPGYGWLTWCGFVLQ